MADKVDPRLSTLIQWHRQLLARREPLANQLLELDEAIASLEQSQLPELFLELGVQDATLPDGTKCKLGDVLSASVAKRNTVEATKILDRIGAGGIAQRCVVFRFDADLKGDKVALGKLLKFSKEIRWPVEQKDEMNTATLKAVASAALKEGKLSPSELDLLGIWVTRKVAVKYPKED